MCLLKTDAYLIQVHFNVVTLHGHRTDACLIQVACLIEVATKTGKKFGGFTVVRLTDHPNMTTAVYSGCKITKQQQHPCSLFLLHAIFENQIDERWGLWMKT